jgi:hypothetical protein
MEDQKQRIQADGDEKRSSAEVRATRGINYRAAGLVVTEWLFFRDCKN